MAKAEKAFEELNDPTIVYPDYYTKPFHAYSEGNLGWLPAFECEPATMSMGLRVWKDEVKVLQMSISDISKDAGFSIWSGGGGVEVQIKEWLLKHSFHTHTQRDSGPGKAPSCDPGRRQTGSWQFLGTECIPFFHDGASGDHGGPGPMRASLSNIGGA